MQRTSGAPFINTCFFIIFNRNLVIFEVEEFLTTAPEAPPKGPNKKLLKMKAMES